jgi:hypothetical protein
MAVVAWTAFVPAACGGSDTGWAGKTFLLEVPSTHWVEPPGIGGDVGGFVPQFLLGVEKAGGANALAIQIATANGGVQDVCNPTTSVTTTGAEYPGVEIAAAAFPLHIVDRNRTPYVVVDTTIRNLAFKDVLPGGPSKEGELSATIDAAEVYPLFRLVPNPSPDSVCAALASAGAPCATCPHSGRPYCLAIRAVQLGAVATPTRVTPVAAADIPASCDATGAGGATGNCTFSGVTATTSPKIPTVGIVTWSTSMAGLTSAKIDFGLTTSYGFTAPVDLTAADYRTLLLGMKASRTYHYRITATGGAGSCSSGDYTLATGAKTNGLPTIAVTTHQASKVAGGFLITGQYADNAGASGAPAYILDADGDIVWWYSIGSNVTGARMSYDGKHMWINKANVPSGAANVRRVTMDGMMEEDLSAEFAGLNHQLTVLPDETVAFYAYGSSGCDDVKERAPDGTVKTIVNAATAQGATGDCHLDTIQYSPLDDTLVFSDHDHGNYTKVTRTGATVWVMGGPTSQFGSDLWTGTNHGLHILGLDRILIFNNASAQTGSIAMEWQLTLTEPKSATKTWSYTANPRINNAVMGDVQRLGNGSTIVAYSTQGVLHEVDSGAELVQTLAWPLGTSFGYIEKRASLYGPPPR